MGSRYEEQRIAGHLVNGAQVGIGGRTFYVDPPRGTDAAGTLSGAVSSTGRKTSTANTIDTAFATVTQGLSQCFPGQNDVVRLLGDGAATGASDDLTTVAWNKDSTHLIGAQSPTMFSQRSLISPAVTFTPLFTLSANDCVIAHIQLNQAHNASSKCLVVTGSGNHLYRCHIAGIGNATAGDSASSNSLELTGVGANLFDECVIGLDDSTAPRSTSCAEIEFLGAAARNIFRRCIITGFADSVNALFVKADGSGDLASYNIFQNCIFINPVAGGATLMTAAMNVNATVGGAIILDNCFPVGTPIWNALDSTNIIIFGGAGTDTITPVFAGLPATVDVT